MRGFALPTPAQPHLRHRAGIDKNRDNDRVHISPEAAQRRKRIYCLVASIRPDSGIANTDIAASAHLVTMVCWYEGPILAGYSPFPRDNSAR